MSIGSFFRKISHGAKRFFHKVDDGASHFFKKTVPNLANKAGDGIVDAGNQVAGAGKKVGNFLEKNSAVLGDVAGGLAMVAGQPELAALAIGAGNAGQNLGRQVSRGSRAVQRVSNVASGKINLGANQVSNVGNTQLGLARGKITNAGNKINNTFNGVSGQLNKLNQLQPM